MKKEKGFTLVELLSVVVILGVTFMFVLPKLVGLINDGEDKETKLIEERVLSAAKDYVNYIDGSFYTKLYKEGDTNYVYKTDLINSGLLNKEEISKLDTFAGVKGELLSNDKLKYTVEYINAEPSEYTNEELYLMIQNISGGGSGSSGGVSNDAIDNLQNQINEINSKTDNNISAITEINVSLESNTTDINLLKDKNSFLDAYPVGSIYISTSDESPSTIGGTWVQIKDTFLLSAGDTYAAGSTGGKAKRLLSAAIGAANSDATSLGYIVDSPSQYQNSNSATYVVKGSNVSFSKWNHSTPVTERDVNDRYTDFMPPYLTVYMWKRTA